jgi:hypothetical protein
MIDPTPAITTGQGAAPGPGAHDRRERDMSCTGAAEVPIPLIKCRIEPLCRVPRNAGHAGWGSGISRADRADLRV